MSSDNGPEMELREILSPKGDTMTIVILSSYCSIITQYEHRINLQEAGQARQTLLTAAANAH